MGIFCQLQAPLSLKVQISVEKWLGSWGLVYNVSPILILVYFKPVCIQMRKCVLRVCGKWCRRCLVPSKQDPMTEMMLASPADDDLLGCNACNNNK